MKPYQIVLTVIVVLTLNNIALISFFDHFYKQRNDVIEVLGDELDTNWSETQRSNNDSTPNSQITLASDTSEQHDQTELTQAVDNYIRSEQFSEVINEWQRKSRKRNQERGARLIKMSANELYSIAFESENANEKSAALYQLTQSNKYKQLSNDELKSLYASDADSWAKENFLNSLLERDDPEALDWAKALIANGKASQRTGQGELYNEVYEKDPEFIHHHISEAEFDDTSVSHALHSFLRNDPDLAASYFSRNLDKILKSQNDEIFIYGAYGINIELSQQQQFDVTELLTSNNKRKRRFAMDLVKNIDDTQALRSAYTTLKLYDEKLSFIGGLLQAGKSTEQYLLGKELAANSNNPNIQLLADQY